MKRVKNREKNACVEKIKLIIFAIFYNLAEIVHIKGIGKYKIIGQTRDDAVDEAFDKAARMIGLSYPGGPEISSLAEKAHLRNTCI